MRVFVGKSHPDPVRSHRFASGPPLGAEREQPLDADRNSNAQGQSPGFENQRIP
jgi:hypothetical protein